MAVDREGVLHVSGNMHGVPLVYFRSEQPLNAASLRHEAAMTGERERRMTYPVFLRNRDGRLIFRYRDGGSGNGDDLYNVYDEKTRSWRRLLAQPLTSGRGRMNAYCSVPRQGPDGRFHMVWVWRDTPDCASNHDLSYARSDDLRSAGPIRPGDRWRSRSRFKPVRSSIGCRRGGPAQRESRTGLRQRGPSGGELSQIRRQGDLQVYAARRESRGGTSSKSASGRAIAGVSGGGGTIVVEVKRAPFGRSPRAVSR